MAMKQLWIRWRSRFAALDGPPVARWLRRAAASCLDQGFVSGMNFLANVLLARWLSPAEYGAFSVAYALFLFMSGFHNALLIDPVCVLGPARFGTQLPRYFKRVVCLHAAWSAAASLVVWIVAMWTPDAFLRRAFCGLALALPFLLLLWLVRRFCYVGATPAAALFSSASYAPFLVVTFLLVRQWSQPSPFTAFLVLGGASLAASATVWGRLGLAGDWTRIRQCECRELAGHHWGYGKWLSATALLTFGVTQLQTFLIAGYLGLEAAGAFRAMFNLVQPMNQVTTATALLFVPGLSADFGAGRMASLRIKGAAITAGLISLSLVYELVLLCSGPRLARLLYGSRFSTYAWVIPVLGLMPVFIALASGCSLLLQACQKPQHYLIRGAVTGPVGICAALILTSWAGLGGAAVSMVLTLGVSALVTLWLYRHFDPLRGREQTWPAPTVAAHPYPS